VSFKKIERVLPDFSKDGELVETPFEGAKRVVDFR